MSKLCTAFLLIVCTGPSLGYAATTSGYDSITPELPIAVQGTAVLDLAQGQATVDGNLTVTGTLVTQGNLGINTLTPTDALDITGNEVVTGNLTVTGTLVSKGDVTVGEDGTGCGGSTAGTMRFDAGSSTIQYCNGASWIQLGGVPSGTMAQVSNSQYCGTNLDYLCSCPGGYSRTSYNSVLYTLGGASGTPLYYCVKN